MDAVLGLSMTPTSVGLVLVEGQEADGATMDRDAFTVENGSIPSSDQAAAAVLRTEAMAATRGLRLHSIGVTWSEEADAQASILMQSLSDSGFENVVAIRMPEATEALARGIADVLGYATTAVCVIEPESVIVLVVNTDDGAVQTAFNHAVDLDESLVSWLSTVFTRADWAPEALVVVGSAGDFEPILDRLEEALSVPVFAPVEAKLALARGAALASAQTTELPLDLFAAEFADYRGQGRHAAVGPPERRRSSRRRDLSRLGPTAMLAAGVVTFVVSVSIAVSLQLAPSRDTEPNGAISAANAETAPAVEAIPPVMPPPAAFPPAPVVEAALPPEPPEAPPIVEAPPVDELPVEAPAEAPAEAPVADLPAADPSYPPVEAVPVDPPAYVPPSAVGTPLPPSAYTPPVYTQPVAPIPTKKPGILSRIKDRLIPGPG